MPRSPESREHQRAYALDAQRKARVQRWMDRYDAILESEGLAPTTTFEEFISICRGQGAMAVLDRLADRNDDRLVRDFPRERALEMKRLLGVALHCLTEHQNVHSLHDRIG